MLCQHHHFSSLRLVSQHITERFSVLTRSKQLRSLTLSHCHDISNFLKEISQSCPFLRNLNIVACTYFKEEGFQYLVNNCPDLEDIVIHDCNVHLPNDYSSFNYNFLTRFPNIRAINLKGLPYSTCLDLRLFADNCPNLVELGIVDLYIQEVDLVYFLLKKKDVLKKLLFNSFNLKDSTWSILSNCQALTTLGIYSFVANNGYTLKFVERLGDLTHIGINFGSSVDVSSWTHFFTHKVGHKFVSIELDCCFNVDDEVLRCISLQGEKLKHLSLAYAGLISCAGIRTILSSCKCLESLTLVCCSGIKIQSVKDVPHIPPHLEQLCIEKCHGVDEEIMKSIAQQFPHLNIIHSEENLSLFSA